MRVCVCVCDLWLVAEESDEELQSFKVPTVPQCPSTTTSSSTPPTVHSSSHVASTSNSPHEIVRVNIEAQNPVSAMSWKKSMDSTLTTELSSVQPQPRGVCVGENSGARLDVAASGSSSTHTASCEIPLAVPVSLEHITPVHVAGSCSSHSILLTDGGHITPVSQTVVQSARNDIGSTSQLQLQHANTAASSSVASSFQYSRSHSTLTTVDRTVGSSISLRDAVNQLTVDVRTISQKQDQIIELLETLAGRASEEGAELDLGQLTLPVSTDEELEQLVVILKDRGARRRLVSAICCLV